MKRALAALWVIFLISFPLWMQDQYLLHILIITGIFTIAAMSLNLLLGYTGQLSLGHVAFFGIGAYVSALVSLGFDVDIFNYTFVAEPGPVLAGFVLAIVIAGLAGYLIGKLSFKVRGAYFVIVTISFAEVTRLVALNWVDLTQGPLALINIPPFALSAPLLGEFTFWGKVSNYYLVLAVALLSYIIIKRLVGSRIGRAMIALRENEPLATSVGIDVTRYLVLAAVVSAALAGAAGSLYAHYVRIIDPDIFLFIYTVTMVIMVITGRQRHARGPGRRRADLRHPARHPARISRAADAVDHLRRLHDRHRIRAAARHRSGGRAMGRALAPGHAHPGPPPLAGEARTA